MVEVRKDDIGPTLLGNPSNWIVDYIIFTIRAVIEMSLQLHEIFFLYFLFSRKSFFFQMYSLLRVWMSRLLLKLSCSLAFFDFCRIVCSI